MIGRIETLVSGVLTRRHVALRLDERAGTQQLWSPVDGDVACTGEMSSHAAVRTCLRSIAERIGLMRVDIAALRKTRSRDSPSDEDEPARLLRTIDERAARLEIEIARLFDEPTDDDAVQLAAKLVVAPMCRHQLRAGRILAGPGLRDLARITGMAFSTIQAIETGATRRPRRRTLEALQRVLTDAGVEFDADGWVRISEDSAASAHSDDPR